MHERERQEKATATKVQKPATQNRAYTVATILIILSILIMSYHYQRLTDDVETTPLVSGATNLPNSASLNNATPKKSSFIRFVAILVIVSAAALGSTHFLMKSSNKTILSSSQTASVTSSQQFDSFGRYIMRNFDTSKPMANFLAGLGGLWGVPMWTFYVNRGQGIAAFGVQNKDMPIMKFSTAEKAYLLTPFTGFRTFVKGRRGSTEFATMPFFPTNSEVRDKPIRNMKIGQNEMEIEEVAADIGLETNIVYFTIPEEDFPALVRKTTFKNLDRYSTLHLEVLDGLGRLIPAGLSNGVLDSIGRTMEAWMNVYNIQGADGDNTQPFFHISQGTADTAQVQIVKEGHFVIAYIEGNSAKLDGDLHELLPFIVDPNIIFGTDTTLSDPSLFYNTPIEELLKQHQGTTSRTPCSFAGAKLTIPPGASVTITSVYGHADTLSMFTKNYRDKVRAKGYVDEKRAGATAVVKTITSKVTSKTSSSLFDMYSEQSFLDNVLRGGLPLALGDPLKPKIYHVYSRIHGDLERDYNNFQIDVTPFSQGPGNFRDVNQNRRIDVLINPAVQDFNVRMFLSFVQADGFNVLTVASTNFKVPTEDLPALVDALGVTDKSATSMTTLLSKSFRIGQFFRDFNALDITSTLSKEDILHKITTASKQEFAGLYNQNGYWADHWTYTMDLVDNYLSVYPDKEEALLYDSEPIPFFFSPAIVKPRSERYLAVNISGYNNTVVRVYNAVLQRGEAGYPADRSDMFNKLMKDPDFIADIWGQGGYWQRSQDQTRFSVSVIAKLTILAINKFSSLDPSGMGVEMEGGKPGWNDAMNGLPGLIGSGMPETYEMLRILNFVKEMAVKHARPVVLPTEFVAFIEALVDALKVFAIDNSPEAEFTYWDASNTARETYRKATVTFFEGTVAEVSPEDFAAAITLMQEKTQAGIAKALATNNDLSPSYFFHECTDFDQKDTKPATATPKAFKLHTLPLFLEGPTRHLKVVPDINERRKIYQRAKASTLYDSVLSMYKICESLKGMGQDVGRMMAFSPGWLENESIWLHMSYKFYLELLRGGLYEEFFKEIETGLVPFMPTQVYGRNPVEASSFIVSSAFPDPKLHGAGFLARLSGSTAEFMSMWAIIMMGENPFVVGFDGKLTLSLRPVLPSWLFANDGTVSFTFLSTTKVVYHNPTRGDTWKLVPKSATVVLKTGEKIAVSSPLSFPEDLSIKVRNLEASTIDIYY